jgi:hypothetical protein
MWPNIWKEIPLFPRRRAITTLSPRTVAPPEPLVHRVHIASSTTNCGYSRRIAAKRTHGRRRPTEVLKAIGHRHRSSGT